ncbi:MAG: hypothetical protein KatS3mg130_1069 [Candidatus Sumerlaea sp.]|jgi:hypothetical protein|nr:MAG: hypothetical protein KatS3mg130_1069 [Candidatus Sumerlaea sp.]
MYSVGIGRAECKSEHMVQSLTADEVRKSTLPLGWIWAREKGVASCG